MNNFGRKHKKSRQLRKKSYKKSKGRKGGGKASKAMKRIRREKGVSVKQAWVLYRKMHGTVKRKKSRVRRRRSFGYDPNMPSTLYFQGPYGQSYGGWGATAPGISAFRRRK